MESESEVKELDLTNITDALKRYDLSEEKYFGVVDLLADLRLYCFANNIEFTEVSKTAQMHFEAERPRGNYKVRVIS